MVPFLLDFVEFVVLLLLIFPSNARREGIEISANSGGGLQEVTKNTKQVECPYPTDIRPCLCLNMGILRMDCSDVKDEAEMRKAFSAYFPTTEYYSLTMSDNKGLKVLENNVFQNVSFEYIYIYRSALEEVQEEALASSFSTLFSFYVYNSEISVFPFSKLPEFKRLEYLSITDSKLESLPPLSSSTIHSLELSFNVINMLPIDTFKPLKVIERIDLEGNNLTEIIPGTFHGLWMLTSLNLDKNNLTFLQSLTFAVNASLNRYASLQLSYNNIEVVEVDAFKDVQWPGSISFSNNSITTLEEAVWAPVLENKISLSLKGNALSCECDIAWFVQHNNYQVLAPDAQCANGTLVRDLDPAAYWECR